MSNFIEVHVVDYVSDTLFLNMDLVESILKPAVTGSGARLILIRTVQDFDADYYDVTESIQEIFLKMKDGK